MISSILLYDTHLCATHMTTSSIRGVQIHIYLVSSTTDPLHQSTVVLKRNKYVCILSIAVVTLLYIMISMITIFSMYIAHVRLGSGRNSYQGHVNDSGEFWRVLGCIHIRRH